MTATKTKYQAFKETLKQHEDIRQRGFDWLVYRDTVYCQILPWDLGYRVKLQVLYVPPEYRRRGYAGELLEILKATCDSLLCEMFLMPVPLRFKRDLDAIDFYNVSARDMECEQNMPLDQPADVDWKTLQTIYERKGFVIEPKYCERIVFSGPQFYFDRCIGSYSAKLGRFPMVYQGKET